MASKEQVNTVEEEATKKVLLKNKKIAKDIADLKALKLQLKELSDKKANFERRIKAYMDDGEVLVDRYNKELVTWKNTKRMSFDSKTFQKEKPKLFAKYQKESTVRTFLVK